eukprot:jgi/Mesen1/6532/ME000333S05839
MEDVVKNLVIVPNSFLCASVGALLGGWLGALGVTINGESHFFIKGAIRGALVFAHTGWRIPHVIVSQAAGQLQNQYCATLSTPLPISGRPNSFYQVDQLSMQQYTGRLRDLQHQHIEEMRKLKEAYDYHKKRAEDAIVCAASVSARMAELQSFFELQETLLEKQILFMGRMRVTSNRLVSSSSGRVRSEAPRPSDRSDRSVRSDRSDHGGPAGITASEEGRGNGPSSENGALGTRQLAAMHENGTSSPRKFDRQGGAKVAQGNGVLLPAPA